MEEARIVRRFRAARLRPTLARIKVLEMLAENPGFQDVGSIRRWMIAQDVTGCFATIYSALQCLQAAGFLLCARNADGSIRCTLKSETAPSRLRIVCRDGDGGRVSFSDPGLHAQILAAAEREGLNLEGRKFELHVGFER
jgi:Fe2+ or Zn2+ uptake regulation protein